MTLVRALLFSMRLSWSCCCCRPQTHLAALQDAALEYFSLIPGAKRTVLDEDDYRFLNGFLLPFPTEKEEEEEEGSEISRPHMFFPFFALLLPDSSCIMRRILLPVAGNSAECVPTLGARAFLLL